MPNATHPEWTDIGALAVVEADVAEGRVQHIDQARVFWPGVAPPPAMAHKDVCVRAHPPCSWGALDPRMTYRAETEEYCAPPPLPGRHGATNSRAQT